MTNYGTVIDNQLHSVTDAATGKLPQDLIPVRKDGVGYMYDRVSGTLFGNSATGELVFGPDKPREPGSPNPPASSPGSSSSTDPTRESPGRLPKTVAAVSSPESPHPREILSREPSPRRRTHETSRAETPLPTSSPKIPGSRHQTARPGHAADIREMNLMPGFADKAAFPGQSKTRLRLRGDGSIALLFRQAPAWRPSFRART